MKNLRLILSMCTLAACSAIAGCEDTGVVTEPDAGTTTPSDGSTGPRVQTLSYRPEGCAYDVSTPQVLDTARSEDVFGDAHEIRNVHTSWAGPTDTTFAVSWWTDDDTLASSVLVGTDEAAVSAADGAAEGVTLVAGHHMLFSSDARGLNPDRVHEAHVCGLTPSTTYYYKVGGAGHWSETFEFTTGPELGSTEPFSFGATGDSRGHEDDAWAISQRRLMERGVDFEVFSGDAVVYGPVQTQWDQFFSADDGSGFSVDQFLATRPLMIANGNHDQLAVNYLAQFALPQQVSDGEIAQGEEWYSFDYANAHFVFLNDTVLDSEVLGGQQAAWLDADLAAVDRARTPWIFVVHHRPLYTCQSTHSPDTSLRSNWQPIFDRYHVDFVIAGHNHVYERSAPINGFEGGDGRVASQDPGTGAPVISDGVPSGTIYMVAAGVGAPLYPVNTTCPTSREGESVRNFVVFEVQGRSLHFTAYDALTGAVIDELEYTK